MMETQKNDLTSNKTKKEDLKDSLDLFGVDKERDILKEATFELKIPKDSQDNMLKISRMIKVAVLTLQGYEEVPQGNDSKTIFKLIKQPLASSEVIKGFRGILQTYADESNMITKQKWESYIVQARADWSAFYKLCLREKASPEEKGRTVYRIFQGCLIKVGEITSDNPKNMEALFGNINRDLEEEDMRKGFR